MTEVEKREQQQKEQRHRRLLRYKVNYVKKRARKEMEEKEKGLLAEEIERRLEEVVRQVEEKDRHGRKLKPVDPADYKPRMAARKPRKKVGLEKQSPHQHQHPPETPEASGIPAIPFPSLLLESTLLKLDCELFISEA